jgi:tetratricopeptide (TPR) repeat protein
MKRPFLFAALVGPALALGQPPPALDAPRHAGPGAQIEPSEATTRASPARARTVPRELAALLADIDATYARRDEPEALAQHRTRLADAEKLAPDEFEVLWRIARLHFWLADDPGLSNKEKSRLGKIGWEYGDRATAANPGRVEGWHFAAAGMGNYALGIGIISALRQGIEGKFKERLSRAEQIDPDFQSGAIQTAWGRFWYELPWPKFSERKSRRALEEALRKNPENVRAHVYVAELDRKVERLEDARAELEKAAAGRPGRYDAPEERRWQEVARRMLAERPEEAR